MQSGRMSAGGAAPATPLSEAMRTGSRAAHEAAESSEFVGLVMAGRVGAADYLAYLERLQPVYLALEDVVDRHRAHPGLRSLHDDRLRRSPALAADLAHWRGVTGPTSQAGHRRSPATEAYVARIHRAAEQPWLVAAHHYTRYLGDLSGGRILQRRLEENFGGDAGLEFYAFADIARPVDFKRSYRDRLDRLTLTDDQRDAVVDEVRVGFALSGDLMAELVPSS